MTTDSSSPNPPPLSADTLAQDLGGTQADGLAQAGENASGMDLWEQALAEQAAATAASTQPAPAQADATSAPASAAAAPKRVDFPPLSDTAGTSVNDLDIIKDIPVQLTVELGRTRITIKNLLQLGQGSVIELDGLAGEPMDIFVNGFLIAQGEVVVVEDKYGIRLTDIVTPSDRLNRLNKNPLTMDSGSILRIIAALLGVISAILLGAWLIRRSGVLGQQVRRHDLRVQASLALGPRHRIVLVSVEGERMLLGLSPQNIQHLATLPPGAAEAEAGDIPAASLPNGNAAPVAGAFQRALNQWRAAQP